MAAALREACNCRAPVVTPQARAPVASVRDKEAQLWTRSRDRSFGGVHVEQRQSRSPIKHRESRELIAYEADIPAIERDLEGQNDEKVSRQWHRRVAGTRVECPSDVHWKVGNACRCDVSVPGFPPGFAEVTLEIDDGKYSWYISNQ